MFNDKEVFSKRVEISIKVRCYKFPFEQKPDFLSCCTLCQGKRIKNNYY